MTNRWVVGTFLAAWAVAAAGAPAAAVPAAPPRPGSCPTVVRAKANRLERTAYDPAGSQTAPSAGARRSRSSFRESCNQLIRARRGQAGNSDLERACTELVRADSARGSQAAGMGSGQQGVDPPGMQMGDPPASQAGTNRGVVATGPNPGPEPGIQRNQLVPGTPAPAVSEPGRNPALGSVPPVPGQRTGGTATSMAAMGRTATAAPHENLIYSDIVGTLNGDGINAEYSRMYDQQLSIVGRARYSRTNAEGTASYIAGLGGGADYFVAGGDNQGLRVGPRLEASFGSRSQVGTTSGFGRLSLLGEVGYNLIATNGLTGVLAGGFALRVAGAQGTDLGFNASGNFSPYLQVGVGYSW